MAGRNGILEDEARVFARYLLHREPPGDLIARYVTAIRTLFPRTLEPTDQVVVDFVRRHPWSLPFIDSAAALFQPGSVLRRKILVFAAILEASPRFVDDFLPQRTAVIECIGKLVAIGAVAVFKVAIGGVLLTLLRRSSR